MSKTRAIHVGTVTLADGESVQYSYWSASQFGTTMPFDKQSDAERWARNNVHREREVPA